MKHSTQNWCHLFVEQYNVTSIIDFATLTGAIMVALGDEVAGFFSNDEKLSASLIKASENTNEKLWRMPLHEDYKSQLKSDIADIKNKADRWGGAIFAALFLEDFVENNKFKEIESEILANFKKDKNYKEKFLKELVEFRAHQFKIDFIKIDAEGEEENIIQGGLEFFKIKSPLVMFEIKAGDQVNLDLIRQFESLGYKVFKLIPGLNILAPWRNNEIADGYLLNLFCCKSDRAKLLYDQGVLIFDEIDKSEILPHINISLKKNESEMPFDNHYLFNFPYAKQFHKSWQDNLSRFNPLLIKSLTFYQRSKTAESANEKYYCLMQAFYSMDSLCKSDSGYLRLSTLARIAKELGNRVAAVNALDILIKNILNTKTIEIGEPFLLPSDDYEMIDPKEQTVNFVWSSLLSSLEKIQYFSSFYAGNTSLDRLNAVIGTGFFDDEISRRRDLVIKRYSI
jgi:hypothetical protein